MLEEREQAARVSVQPREQSGESARDSPVAGGASTGAEQGRGASAQHHKRSCTSARESRTSTCSRCRCSVGRRTNNNR